METIRIEHCTKCDSTKVNNIVQVRRGKPMRVYVRCLDCGSYVCRYTLRRYTSDKPYQSLLNIIHHNEDKIQSGRELLKHIEMFTSKVDQEFERINQLADHEDQRLMEQIIAEEDPETD